MLSYYKCCFQKKKLFYKSLCTCFHSYQNSFNKIFITYGKIVNKQNYVELLLAKSICATCWDEHTRVGHGKNKIEM